MDYKKEIIEMVEKCTNNHWIEVIYIFVKRLIDKVNKGGENKCFTEHRQNMTI